MAGVAYSKHMTALSSKKKSKGGDSSSPQSESVIKVNPKTWESTTDSSTQTAETTASGAPDETASPDVFNDALSKAYNDDLDKEIRKGLALVYERFVRLQSQERPPDWEVAKDDLRNSSTWYENLFWSIKDGVEPGNKETVYMKLAMLPFTNMKNLEAIKQQYQINM